MSGSFLMGEVPWCKWVWCCLCFWKLWQQICTWYVHILTANWGQPCILRYGHIWMVCTQLYRPCFGCVGVYPVDILLSLQGESYSNPVWTWPDLVQGFWWCLSRWCLVVLISLSMVDMMPGKSVDMVCILYKAVHEITKILDTLDRL